MVDCLVIEVWEKQLCFISLGINYQLDLWKLVEEMFFFEYLDDFLFFRRSLCIYLKELVNEIEIFVLKLKEIEGRNDLLKIIVLLFGMVVLSGVISFFSGGNLIMMLSMGGVSLLIVGFLVFSYLINKKEMK